MHKMMDENERSELFDIPEDKTVESDTSFERSDESCEECTTRPQTMLQKLSSKLHKPKPKGADVMALRGIYGAAFEGYASVKRRANKRGLKRFVINNHNTDERFLLIKGVFCFVFCDELSPAPTYVIRLAYTKTRVVDASSTQPDKTTVIIETTRVGHGMEFEFCFVREKHANGFAAMANQMALRGETSEIRERLGEEHVLLHQSELIRHAERISIEQMDHIESLTTTPYQLYGWRRNGTNYLPSNTHWNLLE